MFCFALKYNFIAKNDNASQSQALALAGGPDDCSILPIYMKFSQVSYLSFGVQYKLSQPNISIVWGLFLKTGVMLTYFKMFFLPQGDPRTDT